MGGVVSAMGCEVGCTTLLGELVGDVEGCLVLITLGDKLGTLVGGPGERVERKWGASLGLALRNDVGFTDGLIVLFSYVGDWL